MYCVHKINCSIVEVTDKINNRIEVTVEQRQRGVILQMRIMSIYYFLVNVLFTFIIRIFKQ
jgi:hypothetical protein